MKMRASLAKAMGFGTAAVCLAAIVSIALYKQNFASHHLASAKADAKWADAYGKLPMAFEKNEGQTNPEVRFVSHGQGYQLFLTAQETVLQARSSKPLDFSPRNRAASSKALRARKAANSVIRMRLAGANPKAQITGLEELPSRTDYFIGKDSKNWRTNVPSYARVKYADIYPGVDLIFYGNHSQMEYDYVIASGADPKAIALNISGARKLQIDVAGNLKMMVDGGEIELQKPVAYQEMNGQRQIVASNYVLSGDDRLSFSVGDYDRSKPLIVDPILNYSTYLGGSASGDEAFGIAVDGAGDAYLTGLTFSSTFPTTGSALEPTQTAATTTFGSAFVTELNPAGSGELYSSYLGGSDGEIAFGVAVDTASPANVYVTGQTFSDDFPTTSNAYIQNVVGNGGSGFISKFNPTASGSSSLVYSSYVAGINGDYGNAIGVDANQNAYITGLTFSTGINTANAFQTAPTDATDGNAFLIQIDTTKSGSSSFIYGTYLGGTGANAGNLGYADQGFGVAVTPGTAYITGATASTDFPTVNGLQPTLTSGNTQGTAFLSVINTVGGGSTDLAYSTFLSGEVFDSGYAVALGPSSVAYVTGVTRSTAFPTSSGAYQTTYLGNGSDNAFVTLIDATQTGAASLKYSTYLGGGGGDAGQGIQADSAGNAYISGATDSIGNIAPAFPLTPGALQTTATNTAGVAFVSEISPGGNGAADLLYSTLFGGNTNTASPTTPDRAFGIALDTLNNAYIAGETATTDFPIYPNPGAFQTSLTGSDAGTTIAAFAAKLTLTPTVVVSPTTLSFGTIQEGTPSTQTVTITNNTGIAVPLTLTVQGANSGDFVAVGGGATPCAASLVSSNTPCTVNVTFTPSTSAGETANLVIGYVTYGIASSQTVTLTGTGSSSTTPFTLSPSTFTFATGQLVGTTSAPTTITLTNITGSTITFTTNSTDTTDFTVQPGGTTPCSLSAGLAAGQSCTFTATLNPASGDTGTLTTTFSVTANATTLTDVLTGTGQDFNLSPSTQSVSVAPGGTASPTVTATFLGGFTGPVTLSCSGSIPQGSCTVPASVSASGPVTVTLTTKGSSMVPPASLKTPPISRRQVMLIGFAILLLFTVPFARRRRARLGLVGALVMIVGLAACSGSSGTPAGAYNLTVTGTSNGVTRTAAITLNVT